MARILMIEDDVRLAEMVSDYLGRSGLTVARAEDGASGLAALRRQPPDLVLLDLMLPDGDGLDVFRRIRALPTPAAQTPVIMLTAKGDPLDRVIGLEIGPRITSPSRSSRASCWRASAWCCAAARPLRPPTCCGSAGSRSTAGRAWSGSTARTSR